MTTVVTGINGFLASEIVYNLLSLGKKVIGTVRNESKSKGLRQVFANQVSNGQLVIEYVSSITDQRSINRIFNQYGDEIVAVIHLASGITLQEGSHPFKDFIEPAVLGVRYMLEATNKYCPKVKRFVYAGSMAALQGSRDNDSNYTYTDQSWNPVTIDQAVASNNSATAYAASKKYAEQEAFEFVRNNNEVSFELKSFVIPVTFGPLRIPPATRKEYNVTNEYICTAYLGEAGTGIPSDGTGGGVCADLRLISTLHVQASDPTLSPKSVGHKRYLVVGHKYSFPNACKVLQQLYPGKNIYQPKQTAIPTNITNFDISPMIQDFDVPEIPFKETMRSIFDQYFSIPENNI